MTMHWSFHVNFYDCLTDVFPCAGTRVIFVLMCRKAVNQSIDQSITAVHMSYVIR